MHSVSRKKSIHPITLTALLLRQQPKIEAATAHIGTIKCEAAKKDVEGEKQVTLGCLKMWITLIVIRHHNKIYLPFRSKGE